MAPNIQSAAERLKRNATAHSEVRVSYREDTRILTQHIFFSVVFYRNCWMIFIKRKRTRKIFLNKRKVTSLRNRKFPLLTAILAFQWQHKMCLKFSRRLKELQKITCLCIHVFLKEKRSSNFQVNSTKNNFKQIFIQICISQWENIWAGLL